MLPKFSVNAFGILVSLCSGCILMRYCSAIPSCNGELRKCYNASNNRSKVRLIMGRRGAHFEGKKGVYERVVFQLLPEDGSDITWRDWFRNAHSQTGMSSSTFDAIRQRLPTIHQGRYYRRKPEFTREQDPLNLGSLAWKDAGMIPTDPWKEMDSVAERYTVEDVLSYALLDYAFTLYQLMKTNNKATAHELFDLYMNLRTEPLLSRVAYMTWKNRRALKKEFDLCRRAFAKCLEFIGPGPGAFVPVAPASLLDQSPFGHPREDRQP